MLKYFKYNTEKLALNIYTVFKHLNMIQKSQKYLHIFFHYSLNPLIDCMTPTVCLLCHSVQTWRDFWMVMQFIISRFQLSFCYHIPYMWETLVLINWFNPVIMAPNWEPPWLNMINIQLKTEIKCMTTHYLPIIF